MDNKKLKETFKKKLEKYYFQDISQLHFNELKKQGYSENTEAFVVMGMLNSFENPIFALFIARNMNLCSDVICDDSILCEAMLECCTPEEMQNFKKIHRLSLYGRMTEQERTQWEEEAMALLDNWDS